MSKKNKKQNIVEDVGSFDECMLDLCVFSPVICVSILLE